MLFGDELGLIQHVGEYNPVYIISMGNTDPLQFDVFALHNPLMDSLNLFVRDILPMHTPFYVFTDYFEYLRMVELMNETAEFYFKRNYPKIFEIFHKIALEQGLDVGIELRRAADMSTEAEARAYLTEVNQKLRKLVEDFPHNYDNPVRQYGQRGGVRKKKYILPFFIQWP